MDKKILYLPLKKELIKDIEKNFSKLLTEEMGIIRNVQYDAQMISYDILNGIKSQKSLPTSLNLTTYKSGSFVKEVVVSPDKIKEQPKKKEITIKWHYYSFFDVRTQQEEMHNIPYNTKYIPQLSTLIVVVFAIKNEIDNRTLVDSIAHELTHNFQREVKDNELITNNKQKVYQNANKNIVSSNKAVKLIANVIYLTHSFEQDAFLNGAYAYIMKEYENGGNFIISYKKTEAYVSLETLRYYLDTMQKALDNNKVGENIKNHCHYEYDLSFEQILKLGEKAYSRYTKKLVRMCGKALNDIDT